LRLLYRATDAALIAAGVAIEATVERESVTLGDDVTVNVAVYNRGVDTLHVRNLFVATSDFAGPRDTEMDPAFVPQGPIAPGGTQTYRYPVRATSLTQPEWLASPRVGDMFATGAGEEPVHPNRVILALNIGEDEGVYATAPIVYRYADPVRGEIQRPVQVVPPVSLTLGTTAEYVRAGAPVQRVLHAELRSGSAKPQTVKLEVVAPAGLRAAPIPEVALPAWATRVVDIELRGRLSAGAHEVRVAATSEGKRYTSGYVAVDYPHIRPRHLYREARTTLQAVDVVAPKLTVAYIPGVGDNVAPTLAQLGVDVTVLDPAKLGGENLARFNTIVVGPRAYESSDALVAANGKLLDWVQQGGRLVAQYGQAIMTRPGMMPWPITLAQPADRVTDENAPVRMLGGGVLTTPNRITAQDFAGWVQERALYMPRTFDPHYGAALEMNDPGEAPNRGAILVAPYGRGTYVYTTLSLFRQLPAGVPGAARIMLNLLAADAAPKTQPVP
ncbi:MAG TPA: hypothetical protein VHM30_18005, partial [Gemmatimonadaceae bacterium]|nr:hypothetical protein [Gemmatimonadaceae bacterium]